MTLTATRRALLGAVGAVALGGRALAQAPAAPRIVATRLNDRLTVFSGAGGNVGVLAGPEGLLMIDAGLPNTAKALSAAIKATDARPVKVLLNSHYHLDHVGMNEMLGRQGVKIVAHEKVGPRLATTFYNDAFQRTMEALKPEGMPTETFRDGGALTFGRDRVEYVHFADAHTDGDAYFFMPEMNVIHAADLLWEGRWPVVDYSAEGSLKRMVEGLKALDKVGDEQTRLIPGHGRPSLTKAEVRRIAETWATVNERVERLVAEGRTLDEARAANPTADLDATVGPNAAAGAANFLRQAYGGAVALKKA